jgi:hypothetical protein
MANALKNSPKRKNSHPNALRGLFIENYCADKSLGCVRTQAMRSNALMHAFNRRLGIRTQITATAHSWKRWNHRAGRAIAREAG